jgi:hypothetical protein
MPLTTIPRRIVSYGPPLPLDGLSDPPRHSRRLAGNFDRRPGAQHGREMARSKRRRLFVAGRFRDE